MKVTDVDIDAVAGLDVGHLLFEDIGAVLGQQARPVALRPRLTVDRFGLFAFPQNPANTPFADGHDELADGGPFRQGEYIDRLDGAPERVLELLDHVHRAHVAVDACPHVGVLERQRQFRFVCRPLAVVGRKVRQHRSGAGRGVLARIRCGAVGIGRCNNPQFLCRAWRRRPGARILKSRGSRRPSPCTRRRHNFFQLKYWARNGAPVFLLWRFGHRGTRTEGNDGQAAAQNRQGPVKNLVSVHTRILHQGVSSSMAAAMGVPSAPPAAMRFST